MALKKITEEEMNAQGVIAAPDILNGTPAQNKAIFDRMVRNLVAPAVNACAEAVDEVNANQEEWGKQEQTRETNEEERETEETRREEEEESRKKAEETRESNETERVKAEENRSENEQTRRREHTAMTNAEFERAEAERLRKQAETSREENETKRAAAETTRNQTFAQMKNLIENLDAEAQTLEAEAEATADVTVDPATGGYNVRFGIPRGKDGIGGMDAKVYDPQGRKTDIFAYTDLKILAIMKPEYFGAAADGVTDDSAAIQAAIDAGAAQSMPVYLGKKNYKISTGLVFRTNYMILRCDGTLTYDGTGAAITVFKSVRSVIEINTIYAVNGTAFKVDGSDGSVQWSKFAVNNIRSSKIGLHLTTPEQTDARGPIYYNEFRFNDILSSEIGVFVEAVWDWINENRYYLAHIGGGCQCGIKLYSSLNVAGSVSAGGEPEMYSTGANKFLSGSFEGIAADGCAIYMENTTGNIFSNMRCAEAYGKNSIVVKGQTYGNTVELSGINLNEVDASELGDIKARYTTLRAFGGRITAGGKIAGTEARVSSRFGITYKPAEANNSLVHVTEGVFQNNVIQQVNTMIPGAVVFDSNGFEGQTFTVGSLYSGQASLACGFPLVIKFYNVYGRIKLVDINGDLILDNTGGIYDYKSVSVMWTGNDMVSGDSGKNAWNVTIIGELTDSAAVNRIASNHIAEHDQSIVAHADIRNQANGAMSRLPAEYQAVESITADGNQYFDTSVLASDYPEGLIYEFDGSVNGNDPSVAEYLFGALDSGKRSGNLILNDGDNQFSLNVGGESGGKAFCDMTIGERFELSLFCTSTNVAATKIYKDGIEGTYNIFGTNSEMPNVNIHLLRVNGSSATKYAQATVARFRIRKADGTPIRSFVPCYRKSDGEIGLYDTVACEFHGNLGTGSCTKGADDNTVAVYPYSLADLQTVAENAILGGEW